MAQIDESIIIKLSLNGCQWYVKLCLWFVSKGPGGVRGQFRSDIVIIRAYCLLFEMTSKNSLPVAASWWQQTVESELQFNVGCSWTSVAVLCSRLLSTARRDPIHRGTSTSTPYYIDSLEGRVTCVWSRTSFKNHSQNKFLSIKMLINFAWRQHNNHIAAT